MPRPKSVVPKFCTDRSGRAFCKVDGRFVSLGRASDPECRTRYAEVLKNLAQGQPVQGQRVAPSPATITINELCLAFLLHAEGEYIDRLTGKPSTEYHCFKSAVKHLEPLFGQLPADQFGPNALRAVREKYIEAGWSRGFIAKSVSRLRHIWRWGVARELVPVGVLEALRTLEPLKPGKSAARETAQRRAVPADHIAAAKKHLQRRNRDLVDLLLATGARPLEILCLTTEMIDTTGEVWEARLVHHKNSHRGHTRTVFFGETAKAILARYLRPEQPGERLFPIQRKTFGTAIRDACLKAGVPIFTPHWLRHSAATRFADEAGLEAAQRVLGHTNAAMTEHYSRAAKKKAKEAVQKLG